MWSTFFIAVLVVSVFLYLPGFLLLAAARIRRFVALCCAPVATIVAYGLITTLLPALGIGASWQTVVLPCVAFGAVALAVSVRIAGPEPVRSSLGYGGLRRFSKTALREDWFLLATYVLVGIAVVAVIFVKNLDGPESFLQAWDNSHHLSSIRAFVESGNFCMFTTTSYATELDRSFTPWAGESAFYPSAWHCLGALAVDAAGASVPMAANVVNTVIAALVLPTSMAFLMGRLFPRQRGVRYCGALVTLAFATFPWGFLTFGPLYPNFLSYALLPLVAVFFMAIFDVGLSKAARVVRAVLFMLGIISLAFSQPNAVFSCAVFLAPFCVALAADIPARLKRFEHNPTAASAAFGVATTLGIVLIWVILFKMPFLQDVIWFDWPAKETGFQAIANAALLSYGYAPAQLLLAAFVVLGLFCAVFDRRFRWFACSFLFAFFINIVDASMDGFIKHFLAGFWYTDQLRTASMAALFAVPLASLGLYHVVRICASGIERCVKATGGSSPVQVPALLVAVALAACVYYPSFDIPGHHHVETGFGSIRDRVEDQNSVVKMNYLDASEKDFVAQVAAIVPADQPLINSPDDGSVFLYGYNGTRTYYRYLTGYKPSSGESPESATIRSGLYRIAEDESVRNAVQAIGAQYVLVLDQGKDDENMTEKEHRRFVFKDDIDNEIWCGIRAINDETPGFEVVLAEGDMRLYRIAV